MKSLVETMSTGKFNFSISNSEMAELLSVGIEYLLKDNDMKNSTSVRNNKKELEGLLEQFDKIVKEA